MPNSDPPQPDDPTLAGDALQRLEQRLDRASQAAERLIAEAAAQAGRPHKADEPSEEAGEDKPPPAGWQASEDGSRPGIERELELLAQVIRSVRDLVPDDLQRRLGEALRELLMALRALIDFYLERLERDRPEASSEVEDIPIA